MLIHTYCVFCKYHQVGIVQQTLQRLVPNCKVIYALRQETTISSDDKNPHLIPLFPQYLFIYSDHPIGKWLHDQYPSGIEYWLGNRSNDYELSGSDLEAAHIIYAYDGIIDNRISALLQDKALFGIS